jgi:carbonic anhydrase
MQEAPLAKHLSQTSDLAGLPSTNFERPRGQVEVTITSGVTQAHLAGLPDPITSSRLDALKRIAAEGVSIDFLKFTPSGLSFVCQDDDSAAVEKALAGLQGNLELQPDRCIASIQAANMRAEEGLVQKMQQHKPKYLWIGCSDARVPANELLGEGPGEVFVARNVANLVVNTDVNLMSVIQYAVTALKVSDIIVCGHYDCGGVRAAMRQADHNPPLENWLRNIRDVLWLHREEVLGIPDIDERYRRLVEVNTIQQSLNVFKTGAVQRARVASRMDPSARHTLPRVHAVVYDPTVGELKRLPVDFKKELGAHEEIYKLYQLPSSSPPKSA